ncbi:GGDEF domain-containing protein [bacterium]|nr:GGDEF domain-containing protein [bacterium]
MSAQEKLEQLPYTMDRRGIPRGLQIALRLALVATGTDIAWFKPAAKGLPLFFARDAEHKSSAQDKLDCEEIGAIFEALDQSSAIIPDIRIDNRFKGSQAARPDRNVRMFAAWTVKSSSVSYGCLCFAKDESRLIEHGQQRYGRESAELIATLMQSVNDSLIDDLTGLYERNHMTEMLRFEVRRATRSLQPLSVSLLDIDHFKALNDKLGHDAGDEAIKKVARVLTSACKRAGDLACRWGGEEFLLMQVTTDEPAAQEQMEHVLQQVRALGIESPASSSGTLTCSSGLAIYAPKPLGDFAVDSTEIVNQLIRCADRAMYAAKDGGRDQLKVWVDRPVG